MKTIDTILHGDCLDLLCSLPDNSVDAVITDPPYMIGAISVGNMGAKSGTWADMENAAYWFAAWFQQSRRILRSTGFLAVFTNWRSLPTLVRALTLAEMAPTSCLVWDKQWIGPGGKNGLRPRYEMVLISAMPDAIIPDRGAPDIFACKWMAGNMKTTEHPAEKPVEVMAHLVKLLTPPSGIIVDPFTGSGSSLIAAKQTGRHYIGMERERKWVDTATSRLSDTPQAMQVKRQRRGKQEWSTIPTLWEMTA